MIKNKIKISSAGGGHRDRTTTFVEPHTFLCTNERRIYDVMFKILVNENVLLHFFSDQFFNSVSTILGSVYPLCLH